MHLFSHLFYSVNMCPDKFWYYICGEFTVKTQKRTITPEINKIYQPYFDCPLGDQDKLWSHVICTACSSGLRDWYNDRKKSMPFAIPMIWREPKDHLTNCYFSKVNVIWHLTKNSHKSLYSKSNSAMRPVPHTESLPIPLPSDDDIEVSDDDPDCHKLCLAELNGIVWDLCFSKYEAELLAPRLNEKNLLLQDVSITYFT